MSLLRELMTFPGWSTSRKIVIFESDDWGSVRMSSLGAFERLTKHNLDLGPADSLRFNRYDCLEGEKDLNGLFSVLSNHRDGSGRLPVFTTLCLVANPDFEAIQNSGFKEYVYEPLPSTLERYYPSEKVWSLWKEGVRRGLFCPQFHGREHLNARHWMNALSNGDEQARLSFSEGVWGFNNPGVSYQAAFDYVAAGELDEQRSIIEDGLNLFEGLMGYRAEFFVPPNGLLSEVLYPVTANLGIKYMYSSRMHQVPVGAGRYKTRYNFLGKKNAAGQRFITRNAFFEPSLEGKDWVASCLSDIERAFRWRKPAIISTHRVNFIGTLVERNRKNGLEQLDELLRRSLRSWPELEFMTTPELGKLMDSE